MKITEISDIACSSMDAVLEFISSSHDFAAITQRKDHDVTRRFDLIAEKELCNQLLDRGIGARVISEELGDRIVGDSAQCTFIFDPIDGSTNASIGFPFFCSSLAYSGKSENVRLSDIELGVIRTNTKVLYTAQKGEGAYVNGRKIKERKVQRYKPIISAYSYGVPEVPLGLIELEKRCIVRVFGSIALEMCMVASGQLNAVIDTRGRLRSYDIAAGQLIVRESGGIVTDENNNDLQLEVDNSAISLICSKDSKCHAQIIGFFNV
ncbi:MAG: inositol monophosphatase family protein [Halobacteriota archaeon]